MLRYYAITCSFLICISFLSAQQVIKLNQVGFNPDSEKIAVIPGNHAGEFRLIDDQTEEIVYAGALQESKYWEYSEETATIADFSAFSTPGIYRVEHDEAGLSFSFRISDYIYSDLTRSAIRAYYFNRASIALEPVHAGIWSRSAGHPDTSVIVHPSAASGSRPAGSRIASPRGWYDAGDFNKYVVNSGISTYTLLAAYEHFPEYYAALALNIPESGNQIPDILAEARWNIEWMLTMQDPEDGGVYHKLTTANFPGIVMPHQDTASRYVVQKSTAASLNFAAVMATASRVFTTLDPDFSGTCLDAAEHAWQWAVANPDIYYRQNQMNQQYNPNINTGEYGDNNVSDEFEWAAAELYITTRNDNYWNAGNFSNLWYVGVASWQYVRPLLFISLVHHHQDLTEAADIEHITGRLRDQADILANEYHASAYRISMGHVDWEFLWGSNGMALNHSMFLIQAYRLTGDESYLNAAQANFDYILGRNPTGYSFVTGYGSKTPMYPHHRQSAADGIPDPIPGFVVGGPHNGQQDGCPNYPSNLPALSYLDDWCSYSTNEVAINWNAPLVYVAGALDAIRSGNNPPVTVAGPPAKPHTFKLDQNFPNPFNPSTVIGWRMPAEGRIRLAVFDLLGREVAVLAHDVYPAGEHRVEFNASALPSGVYIYHIEGWDVQQSRRMLLVR